MADDAGHARRLITIIPLGEIEQMDMGMMVFEPRRATARELYLKLSTKPNGSDIYLIP